MQTLPPTPDEPLLLHGDCLDVLGTLPAASVDVVVTDPPAGIGFMGKPWDSFARYKPRTKRGREVDSMLGGGDLLARAANVLLGLSLSSVTEGLPARAEAAALAEELRSAARAEPLAPWARGFVVFMVDVWSEVLRVLKPGGLVFAWALPKTSDLAGLAMRHAGLEMHETITHLFGQGMNKSWDIGKQIDKAAGAVREVVGPGPYANRGRVDTGATFGKWSSSAMEVITMEVITAPATEAAKRWDGWHSQVAPGCELWQVGRAPTPLTYAAQVQEHGCGAFNVGACRIPRGERPARTTEGGNAVPDLGTQFSTRGGRSIGTTEDGSHPRNVILTTGGEGCPAEGLDRQSGEQRDGKATSRPGRGPFSSGDKTAPTVASPSYDGSGGASRYFTRFDEVVGYFPKADDRTIPGSHATNRHPTHKHVALMRWLVRLAAAKSEHTGGDPAIVLDCFMGSGTTGVAAVAERVRFIGIEQDPEHFAVARARILGAIGSAELAAEANADAPEGSQLSLL